MEPLAPENFTEWGALEASTRALEQTAHHLVSLWNRQNYRMKASEVERMTIVLKRLRNSVNALHEVNQLYKGVTSKLNEQVISLEIPSHGFIPAHLATLEAQHDQHVK